MPRVRQLEHNGQSFTVREEDFEPVREDWNEYHLTDGGRVRVRTTVTKIMRVLDANGQPKYTADGDPEVLVASASQVIATE